MLYFHSLSFVLASVGHNTDGDLEANALDPPNNGLGRSESMLTDIMMPEENLHMSVEEQGFLDSIRSGLANSISWQGVMENLAQFPKFGVKMTSFLN